MNLAELKKEFPSVEFETATECHYPRCETATYTNHEGFAISPPKGETVSGEFIRMTNRHGGSDTIPVSDIEGIRKLAAWHAGR